MSQSFNARLKLLSLLFILFFASIQWSYAGSHGKKPELIDIKISVGEWPPFLTQTLPNNGIVAHLISDVFKEAGYQVTFEFLPWVRAYKEALDGNYSATGVWMYKDDRSYDYYYSDPVLNEQFVLFYSNNKEFDWTTFEDLRGLTFGGGIGYSYGPVFDKALEDGMFNLIRQPTVEQNLRMLAAGRIDLFVEEKSVAQYKLMNDVPELANDISYHPKPVLINQSFLLLPKDAPDSLKLMEAFNTYLEVFKQDGRYKSYFQLN